MKSTDNVSEIMFDDSILSSEKEPFDVSEVICVKCWTRWLCVRPSCVFLSQLECAGCHETGGVIETGEDLSKKGGFSLESN